MDISNMTPRYFILTKREKLYFESLEDMDDALYEQERIEYDLGDDNFILDYGDYNPNDNTLIED